MRYITKDKNTMIKMNFENWYSKMISEGAPSATAIKGASLNNDVDASSRSNEVPTVSVPSKEEILGDVDSIMTQLNQLSAQIKEDRNQIENEWNLVSLDESLILEGSWEDTKQTYSSLFSDPVFQLVGLGITAVLIGSSLPGKAVKDSKRNKAIATMALSDFDKLKKIKIEAIHLEATKIALEEKRDEIRSSNVEEAEAPVKPNAQKPTKPAANKKPLITSKDKDTAKDKMVSKIQAQIDAIEKKQMSLDSAATKFEEALSSKYSDENVTGYGSSKVRGVIAAAKDGIDLEIAELKLKLFSDTMEPETAKNLKERLTGIKQRTQERQVEIEQEAKEAAEKAKEIADKDEETRIALEKIKERKNKKAKSKTSGETSNSTSSNSGSSSSSSNTGSGSAGPSTALQQVQKDNNSVQLDLQVRLLNLLETVKPNRIKDVEQIISEVSSKEAWQLENTTLSKNIEMKISLLEKECLLNESKYFSISDKFKALLG